VYLYGVDVMSTADIKAYFGDYGPRFVEWINDSSCAARGLRGQGAAGAPRGAQRKRARRARRSPTARLPRLPRLLSRPAAAHSWAARRRHPPLFATGCVLFADAASAARAIVGCGHPLPPDQEGPDSGGQTGEGLWSLGWTRGRVGE
jgi:hypothetical protein